MFLTVILSRKLSPLLTREVLSISASGMLRLLNSPRGLLPNNVPKEGGASFGAFYFGRVIVNAGLLVLASAALFSA